MKYTTPEEVLTYLPNNIRQSSDKNQLITQVIRGYKSLKIPQDKNYQLVTLDTTTSHSTQLPLNLSNLINVWMIQDEKYIELKAKFIKSDLCKKCKQCDDCVLSYSLTESIITLPELNTTYCLLYNALYSTDLKIYDDEDIKNYLMYYVTYQEIFDRALSSDTSARLLGKVEQNMNATYMKARGTALLQNHKLEKLDLTPINLTIDEFSNRLFRN
jgi:hypothetical protein